MPISSDRSTRRGCLPSREPRTCVASTNSSTARMISAARCAVPVLSASAIAPCAPIPTTAPASTITNGAETPQRSMRPDNRHQIRKVAVASRSPGSRRDYPAADGVGLTPVGAVA